jgi:DUF1680 family protein
VDLGGWYTSDTFHVFGQIVSGLARMHAATGDPACREKVDALVHEWGRCIAPDGFFYYSPEPKPRHYNYDKMVGGLVDAACYCDNKEALDLLARITAWAEPNLARYDTCPFGSLTALTEWYTLGENLYRAYQQTGEARYREFAGVWEYRAYWELLSGPGYPFGPGRPPAYHAYSHVNTLCGAAAAYLAGGRPRDLEAARNGFDWLQATQVYATGGYGPNECLLPRPLLLDGLLTSDNHFETQCGTWAAFKLSKYLISITGDAHYGDWIERLAINGIGASVPTGPDGRVFYYADYNPGGGTRSFFDFPWSCCTGTRIQATADYCDLIYFRDGQGLYVNLFAPSIVTAAIGGQEVTLRQDTRFPELPESEFTVEAAGPRSFALHFRVPGWIAGPMTARLNGSPVDLIPGDRHWVTLDRKWQPGDRVRLDLPMRFWSARFPPDSDKPFPAAVLRGPVVLAFRAPAGNPSRQINLARLGETLLPCPGEALTYRLAGDQDVLARPFAAIRTGETYFIHLDPEDRPTWVAAGTLRLAPPWTDMGLGMWAARQPGTRLSFTFTGTGIRWAGRSFDDAGMTEVRIDGRVVDKVDQYGPVRGLPFRYEIRGLSRGRHTITLTLLAEKHKASRDTLANLNGFAVLDAGPAGTTAPEASRPSAGMLFPNPAAGGAWPAARRN